MRVHLAELALRDLGSLSAARAKVEADPEVWAVLAFLDGDELPGAAERSAAAAEPPGAGVEPPAFAIEPPPGAAAEPWAKPLILAASGTIAGPWTALALAADILLATPETRFAPAGEPPLDAPAAHRLGLVNELVAAEELRAAGRKWAEAVAAASPLAVAAIREAATAGLESSLPEAIAGPYPGVERYSESADAAEALRALVEGRRPHWRGR